MIAERIGILYLMLIVLYFCYIVSCTLSLVVITVVARLALRRLRSVIICAGYLLLSYLLDSKQGAVHQYESSGNISGTTDLYWPVFCGAT